MKNSLATIGLFRSVFLVAIMAFFVSSARVVVFAKAVEPSAPKGPSMPRLIALPRLIAAGSKDRLWLTVPSKSIKPQSGPQFTLLSHTLNARNGNAALWRQVSMGAFTGYPVCALAVENPAGGAMKQGVYLFFQNNYGVCFGLKESISLPSMNGNLFPVSVAGENGDVYLLAYGTVAGNNNRVISPVRK